ncbi:hypothetical protein, partial [Bartonella taylorii]|uniref:hypothetical protein n=1 Tax=Bartonella taylorii TaxID=33046 RepID=UPI001FCD0366
YNLEFLERCFSCHPDTFDASINKSIIPITTTIIAIILIALREVLEPIIHSHATTAKGANTPIVLAYNTPPSAKTF